MGRSLLTEEEKTMIRTKYLPNIYKEYRDVAKFFVLVSDHTVKVDDELLYLSDEDQIKLLKRMGVNALELRTAVQAMLQYLIGIRDRLEIV